MLNIKRLGQVEVDHNDRPIDDVMIKKGSVLMQWAIKKLLRRRKMFVPEFCPVSTWSVAWSLFRNCCNFRRCPVRSRRSRTSSWRPGGRMPRVSRLRRTPTMSSSRCALQDISKNLLLISVAPGAVLEVLVHPEDHRQGEGWEAEAVSAPGPAGWFESFFFNISLS